MERHPSVDKYIEKHAKWKRELQAMRQIMLESGMEETVKWGGPVYMVSGKNVVGLGGFKEHVAIWFFQGALLKDEQRKLIAAQDSTKALRQWRFASWEEIERDADVIRRYVAEAIENQKAGKSIGPARNKPIIIPPELQQAFDADAELKKCFDALAKSKQRDFAEYIAEAKREATKRSRLEKIIPMIRAGVGLHDKYKKS